MPEFFVSAYYYCFELEDYENALVYADEAIKVDPLNEQMYKVAALTAIEIGDPESAWYYLKNGIMLDNADGDIITLAATFWASVEDYDNARYYLDMARMGSVSRENDTTLKNLEAKLKEVGK